MKKLLALLLVMCMAVTLVLTSCGGDKNKDKTYSLAYTMSASPSNFNPHTWEMNNDDEMLAYTTIGFVDIGYKKNADGTEEYEWLYEMASSIKDITKTYGNASNWGVTADQTGRVWEIKLNPNAAWQDGTAINADSYIYSMKQLLNPQMKNYRANTYYSGDTSIVGAYDYYLGTGDYWTDNFDGDQFVYARSTWVKGADGVYTSSNGEKLVFALNTGLNYLSGKTLDSYKAYLSDKYADLVKLADKDGNVPVTDNSIALLTDAISTTGEDGWNESEADLPNYVNYLDHKEATSWDSVGLLKADDYTLIYITESPVTQFYFNIAMSSTWLVNETLYEANKETVSDTGLVVSKYGTSVDTYMSYGPYKLTTYTDSSFVLERNDQFFKNGAHAGQYQCDKITYHITSEHNTELLMFLSGQIDQAGLQAADMAKYKYSDNLLKTDLTYTFRYIFCSDYEALVALEKAANDGSNKRCLAYTEFRNAMSLAINRTQLAAETTAGSKAMYALLNSLYYYDVENDPSSIYRDSEVAMKGILKLYGVDTTNMTSAEIKNAYKAITGYSVEDSKELFQSAYDKMVAAGDYTDGQKINLTVYCSAGTSVTSDDLAQCELLNKYFKEATKGTPFEDKITVTFKTNDKRYDAVRTGQVEMARGAWGGAAFYPFSSIRVYADPDYTKLHEASGLYYEGSDKDWGGFDPTVETMTLKIGDKTVTKTIQEWSQSINTGDYATADAAVKLEILSAVEQYMLSNYYCIPIYSECEVSIYSKKISYATTTYNIMYAYGGIRYMTFNYSDAEWADYVKAQGGQLDYQ